jgi:Stage II sporulation protein E (SpoIIE)
MSAGLALGNLIASMIKTAMHSVDGYADEPTEVLRRLGKVVSGDLRGQFVSAAYLWIDTETHIAKYAAAGHPPLLVGVLRSDAWNVSKATACCLASCLISKSLSVLWSSVPVTEFCCMASVPFDCSPRNTQAPWRSCARTARHLGQAVLFYDGSVEYGL